MKRVIVDFKKLTDEILNLLVEKYPDGYNDSDIITFKNASGETIEAVEVRTEDTDYLVKVSVKLAETMENFLEDEEDEEDEEDSLVVNIPVEKEIDFGEIADGDLEDSDDEDTSDENLDEDDLDED